MVIRDWPGAPEPPASSSEAKGYRFGRYRLIRPLGMGGMAQVWLAIKTIFGGEKVVALKMPADLLGLAESDQVALLNEIRIASQFSHSNIVQVFDAGVHRGVVYMELERVDGIDLEQLLEVMRQRGAPLAVDIAVYVWRCVLEALHYAYTYERDGKPHSVIHRDLNPSNVLISSSGEVKVMDFGIAKLVSHETSGNHIKGKPRYMPPEQISGRSTTRVDLFGAAAMFWEMVEGKRFRHDVPTDQLIACALSGRVPEIASPRVDDDLKEIYARCTHPDPEKRLANPGEVLAMLRRWQGRAADPATLRELYAWQLQTRRHSGYTDAEMPALPERMLRLLQLLRQIDKEEETEGAGAGTGAGSPGSSAAAAAVAPGMVAALESGAPAPTPQTGAVDGAPTFFRRSRGSSGFGPLGVRGVRESVLDPTEDGPIPGQTPTSAQASPAGQAPPPGPTQRFGDAQAAVAAAAARTEVLPGGGMPAPTPTPGAMPDATPDPKRDATRETTRDGRRESTEPTMMTVVRGGGRTRVVLGAIAAVMCGALVGLAYVLVPDADDGPDTAVVAASGDGGSVERTRTKGTGGGAKAPGGDARDAAVVEGAVVEKTVAQASGPKLLPVPVAVAVAEPEAEPVPVPTAAIVPTPAAPEPAVAPTPEVPAAAAAIDAPEPAAEPEPAPEPKATAPKQPKPKAKPAPLVDVRLAPNFAEGQVKIGKKVWTITKTTDERLPAGTHKLSWRPKEGEPWRVVDPLRLTADRQYMVRVGATTLKVTSIPRPGGAP